MAKVIACKLPHGLTIGVGPGRRINLNGPNEPTVNGVNNDSATSAYGYGLTTLDDKDASAFDQWAKSVTFKDDGKTKLDEPFPAIENGQILTFGSEAEARKELKDMAAHIVSGFEGIEQNDLKNGVKTDAEAMKNK